MKTKYIIGGLVIAFVLVNAVAFFLAMQAGNAAADSIDATVGGASALARAQAANAGASAGGATSRRPTRKPTLWKTVPPR